MMAGVKRIYILIIKVNKLLFFFLSQYFLKEIENMFCVSIIVEFCFSQKSLNFDSTSSWETLRLFGNKIHCSPQNQSLSVNS